MPKNKYILDHQTHKIVIHKYYIKRIWLNRCHWCFWMSGNHNDTREWISNIITKDLAKTQRDIVELSGSQSLSIANYLFLFLLVRYMHTSGVFWTHDHTFYLVLRTVIEPSWTEYWMFKLASFNFVRTRAYHQN
jgi:hypothetical protein